NNIIPIALSGILGIAIGDSLFFASLNRLSPLFLSLLVFVAPDIFSGVFGFIFLKEIPSIISFVGIVLVLVGLSFLIFPIKKENSEVKTKITGIIFAILSLACTAYSMVIIKPILVDVPVITATMYRMIFSAVILLFFGLFTKKIFLWKNTLNNKKYNIQLIGTFALATIGGFWLSLVAIKYCKLIIASSLMSLEPLFILIFMILFSRYIPKIKEIIGILIIVFGIVFVCLG
ncbi:DMT family transporter, partial [bacterium]|nr:DMT family transporter [bacterium]